MGVDRNLVIETAQQFAARGQYDKAIAEWKKLVIGSSEDGAIYNTIGDLHLKRNAPADAIEAYLQGAAAFRTAQAALKAIALYKKALKVDPNRGDVYQRLGDLNAERGVIANAVSDYLMLARWHQKAGRSGEAQEVYRKIAQLDPSNQEARQHLGGVAPQEPPPSPEPAATSEPGGAGGTAQPEPRGATLQMAGMGGPSSPSRGTTGQKARELDRQEAIQEAIRHATEGRYDEAESVLADLLNREPGDPEVCRLLASMHLKQGALASARAESQFLAEAALRAQDCLLAESILQEYLEADPNCVIVRQLFGRVYEQKGDPQTAARQYEWALEVVLEHPDPELPSLPAELYEKIVELAPDSPSVAKYAALFGAAVRREEPEANHQAGMPVASVVGEAKGDSPKTCQEEARKKRRISYI